MRSWPRPSPNGKNDAQEEFTAFAVCSDVQVSKRRKSDDIAELDRHDLAFPATTDPAKLASRIAAQDGGGMVVVFATYQSIKVISDAQQQHGLAAFDLIICDEAHRTTGATLAGEDESNFVRIHDDKHVKGRKRLYMTATPRIFGDVAKSKADEAGAVLASMDDPTLFGEVLFERGFSWAVENDLLSDYKVIVLAVDEETVSRSVQTRLRDGAELRLDDATKIIGCYKGLAKQGETKQFEIDPSPMRRALAFCKDIKSSKLIEAEFARVADEFVESETGDAEASEPLRCEVQHVDGTFNAKERGRLLDWLKAETDDGQCRILTNARCLSEGVDVPALDGILFLHPRKSQIDVVQSVGRVMRKAEGKKLGYVILPIGIPAGMAPEQALNDNDKYRIVWQILNALRAHDDRFDSNINRPSLGEDITGMIEVVAVVKWIFPGNTPDVSTVQKVKDDLREMRLGRTLFVGDAGMYSKANLEELSKGAGKFVLATPIRRIKEIRDEALSHPGRYAEIAPNLRAKEVVIGEGERRRRYILCLNEEEADRQKWRRAEILETLKVELAALKKDHPRRACQLLASKRYGPYLSQNEAGRPYLDQARIKRAEHLDGKFVLTTNDDTLSVADIALGYKGMWIIESCFRPMKTTGLEVRPMFHWMPHRITAHVKLCVLALMIQRAAEIATEQTWRQLQATLESIKAVRYTAEGQSIVQTSNIRPEARDILKKLNISMPKTILDVS